MVTVHAGSFLVLISTSGCLHLWILIHLILRIQLSCSKQVVWVELVMQLVDLLVQVLIVLFIIS